MHECRGGVGNGKGTGRDGLDNALPRVCQEDYSDFTEFTKVVYAGEAGLLEGERMRTCVV